jgi:hypothetical protein
MKKVIVTSGWGAGYPEGGGMQWLNLHYMAGLRALGIEGFWLDMTGAAGEGLIQQFQARCERFGFGDRWIVLREGKQVFGMNDRQLAALCADCDLLINLCGALQTDELLGRIKRRAYFDLDPGFTQAWAHQFDMHFAKHNLFFTVGLNVGGTGFPIPTQGIQWQTFLPPVALEYWPAQTDVPTRPFTTIAQWRGQEAVWEGDYYGPKREEFLRFIDLPGKTPQPIELALLIHESETDDLAKLRDHDWQLVNPHEAAGGLDGFRAYVQQSRAEFSVAKGGYVKSRGGWFSDRTVCYLASGRPVLVQDTGLAQYLPTGRGLMTFSTMEEAVAGIEAINTDYTGHCAAARKLAEEKFAAPVVLQSILERAGVL